MKIASIENIRAIEEYAIKKNNIPESILMENAAHAVLRNIDKTLEYYVIVCGTGNNGGDGLVVARLLASLRKQVDVYIVQNSKSSKSQLFLENLKILENYDVSIYTLDENTTESGFWSFEEAVVECDILIDAIYGIGFRGNINPLSKNVIDIINRNSCYTVSLDVPSGLNVREGGVFEVAVKADLTITFIHFKKAFLNYEVIDYLGEVKVESIGIAPKVLDEINLNEEITEHDFIVNLIPIRNKTGYKGNYGRVLVVAGSEGFLGANKIAREATIATGAGLVTVSSHKSVFHDVNKNVMEAMSIDPDKIENSAVKSDVIAFGPGLGRSRDTIVLLMRIIRKLREEGKTDTTLVLDADGLNVLEGKAEILRDIGVNVIVTPHIGEMSLLTGHSIDYIVKNRAEVATQFAKDTNSVVVLKGYNTIITNGEKTYINPTGSSSMASGGMGDCLTGIISGLCGQMDDHFMAAVLGVYIHGYIADNLSKDRYSVSAGEIIERIPFEMKNLMLEKIESMRKVKVKSRKP